MAKEAMGDLPKPEGKVTLVMDDEKAKCCTVTVTELEPDDAARYIDILKEMSIEGGNLSETTGLIIFSGDTDKNTSMHFHYSPDDKEGIIIYYPEGLGYNIDTPNTAAEAGNDEAGSEPSEYEPSKPAEAVKLPEHYPENIFPINEKDIIIVARVHEFENGVEYSLILESQMGIEEIVKYYKDNWGPMEGKYESVSATEFELVGTIKGYEVAINGYLVDEALKKVEYYIYIIEYDE